MVEDRPQPLSDHVRQRMRTQPRIGTAPEMTLRRMLFAQGVRYRVGIKVPGLPRRTIDIAFPKQRLAVFVDGCFWHRCPMHGVPVKNNSDWWNRKLQTNVDRDRTTDQHLREAGWRVLRFWEHEPPDEAAKVVVQALARHLPSSGGPQ